jgi:uncharacterized protein YbjT (DUF2867 family)
MFVVAGVTGHVGSVVAKNLLAAGEKVKVLVRDAAKGAEWSKRGAEVAVAELLDTDKLTAALKGAEGFFTLLPANYGAAGFYAVQNKTSDSIAKAVKASGVPHVVILSSIGADLEKGTGPIRGLHYLEKALATTGTKLTAVRAGYFQENFQSVLGAAKGAGIFPNMTPSADYAFPMIATQDIGDLVSHELRFPSAKSDVVDLAGPSYSIRQVAEALGKQLGKPLTIVDVPAAGHVAALQQAGMSQELAEIMAEMNAGFASGAIKPVGDRFKQGRTKLETVISQVK